MLQGTRSTLEAIAELTKSHTPLPDLVVDPVDDPLGPLDRYAKFETANVERISNPFRLNPAVPLPPGQRCAYQHHDEEVEHQRIFKIPATVNQPAIVRI